MCTLFPYLIQLFVIFIAMMMITVVTKKRKH